MLLCGLLLVLVRCACLSEGLRSDNYIVGHPMVECAAEAAVVEVNTFEPFQGRVYIKGRSDKDGCCGKATHDSTIAILVPHLTCGSTRVRSASPRGINISNIVVVSFHPVFNTAMDQAYVVNCFHAEQPQQSRRISHLPPTPPPPSHPPMPKCRYEILHGDGRERRAASVVRIGEQIFHHWTCEWEDETTMEGREDFCVLVSQCFVEDAFSGRRYSLLDEDGCATDPFILPDLQYLSATEAGQLARVFAFADKPQLFFQCQINIEHRLPGGGCFRPNCSADGRERRRRRQSPTPVERAAVLDAATQRLHVVDGAADGAAACADDSRRGLPAYVAAERAHSVVCLSALSFGVVVTSTVLVAITTLVVVAVVLCQRAGHLTATVDPLA